MRRTFKSLIIARSKENLEEVDINKLVLEDFVIEDLQKEDSDQDSDEEAGMLRELEKMKKGTGTIYGRLI